MDGFQGWAGVVATLLPDKGDRIKHMRGPTYPTIRQLYQGAVKAGKTRPEESLATEAQGRGFESRSVRSPIWMLRRSFSSFSYHDNDCINNVPILLSVGL